MTKTARDYLNDAIEAETGVSRTLPLEDLFTPAGIRVTGAAIKAALAAPRLTMSEAEMLQRARRACAALARGDMQGHLPPAADFEAGKCDSGASMKAALSALRDLDKPLVDPIVLRAREICATEEGRMENPAGADAYRRGIWDNGFAMRIVIAALEDATRG